MCLPRNARQKLSFEGLTTNPMCPVCFNDGWNGLVPVWFLKGVACRQYKMNEQASGTKRCLKTGGQGPLAVFFGTLSKFSHLFLHNLYIFSTEKNVEKIAAFVQIFLFGLKFTGEMIRNLGGNVWLICKRHLLSLWHDKKKIQRILAMVHDDGNIFSWASKIPVACPAAISHLNRNTSPSGKGALTWSGIWSRQSEFNQVQRPVEPVFNGLLFHKTSWFLAWI